MELYFFVCICIFCMYLYFFVCICIFLYVFVLYCMEFQCFVSLCTLKRLFYRLIQAFFSFFVQFHVGRLVVTLLNFSVT